MLSWMKDHHEAIVDGVFMQPEQVRAEAQKVLALPERPAVVLIKRWDRPGVCPVRTELLLRSARTLEKLEGKPTDDY